MPRDNFSKDFVDRELEYLSELNDLPNPLTKQRELWKSIILWPDEVCLGRTPNESEDTHWSKEAAVAVCRGVAAKGLGGEGKIFPISWRVQRVA